MKIGIHDNDQTSFPNLALMKLSAYHKAKKDHVEFFVPAFAQTYDRVYSSKVFSWAKTHNYLPKKTTIFGGSGHSLKKQLPKNVEHICPDYGLYNCEASYGFLTRGCPNNCSWCLVSKKEGSIKPYADIQDFLRHKHAILMDNNVLAHDHGIHQIEKISKMDITVDFNQGLDARLIDDGIAKLLSKIKWNRSVRLACDSMSMVEPVRKAVELLRWHNTTPSQYFCYVLVQDIEAALEIIRFLKGIYVYPFAQPFRDQKGTEPSPEHKHFARWVNRRELFRSITWEDYKKC